MDTIAFTELIPYQWKWREGVFLFYNLYDDKMYVFVQTWVLSMISHKSQERKSWSKQSENFRLITIAQILSKRFFSWFISSVQGMHIVSPLAQHLVFCLLPLRIFGAR